MVSGALQGFDEVVLPLELLPLLQAARTLTESTATALRASVFFENQGRSGRTPGSSFRLVQDSPGFEPAGNVRVLTFEGYTGPMRCPPDECREIYVFCRRRSLLVPALVRYATMPRPTRPLAGPVVAR